MPKPPRFGPGKGKGSAISGMAFLLLLWAGADLTQIAQLIHKGEHTTGAVISEFHGNKTQAAVVRYAVGSESFFLKTRTNLPAVSVVYLADRPKIASVDTFTDLWGPALLKLLGVVMVGLYAYHIRTKKLPPSAHDLLSPMPPHMSPERPNQVDKWED